MKSLSPVPLFVTPWTVTYQAPLSMGFSRQKYWSGLPFPSPGDFPQPRNWTQVSHIIGRHFTVWATREAKVLIAQLCPTLCDPMDYTAHLYSYIVHSIISVQFSCSVHSFYGLYSSSVHGILQARILELVAIPFSGGSSWLRDWTWDSCIAGRVLAVYTYPLFFVFPSHLGHFRALTRVPWAI